MRTGLKDFLAKEAGLILRYGISGGIAALAHFGVLITLVEWATMNPTLASAIGFCVAIVINYTFQYHWTFKAVGPHGVVFIRYVVVTIAMLGVNTIIFWILNAQMNLPYVMAQVIATGTVVVLNFNINRLYTFNSSTCEAE